jgi:hypothetical protein
MYGARDPFHQQCRFKPLEFEAIGSRIAMAVECERLSYALPNIPTPNVRAEPADTGPQSYLDSQQHRIPGQLCRQKPREKV